VATSAKVLSVSRKLDRGSGGGGLGIDLDVVAGGVAHGMQGVPLLFLFLAKGRRSVELRCACCCGCLKTKMKMKMKMMTGVGPFYNFSRGESDSPKSAPQRHPAGQHSLWPWLLPLPLPSTSFCGCLTSPSPATSLGVGHWALSLAEMEEKVESRGFLSKLLSFSGHRRLRQASQPDSRGGLSPLSYCFLFSNDPRQTRTFKRSKTAETQRLQWCHLIRRQVSTGA